MIALLGGTFDPVHVGHLTAAESARQILGVSQVNLVLARQPYHKAQCEGATTQQRWAMLELACKDHALLVADDSELHHEGPSFTVDLLERRATANPREMRCWVIGSDAFAPILGWRRADDVFRLTNFLVFERAGMESQFDAALQAFIAPRAVASIRNDQHGQVLITRADLPDVSSSRIREMHRAGQSVSRWLSPAVLDFIRNNNLYV